MNFRDRLEKIDTLPDLEKQLSLAKAYCKRLRSESKRVDSLKGKLALLEKQKEAERSLRELRQHVFDIEDAINDGLQAVSVLKG